MYLISKFTAPITKSTSHLLHNPCRAFAVATSLAKSSVKGKKLAYEDGKLVLPVEFHLEDGSVKKQLFQVNPACKYTQLNTKTARALNLRSSYRLVSKTEQPEPVYHYLCGTTLFVDGNELPLVVKVAPDSPDVLGLNALLPLRAAFDLGRNTYEVQEVDEDDLLPYFNWSKLVEQRAYHDRNLAPVHWLMPPASAVASFGAQYLINADSEQYLGVDVIPVQFGLEMLNVTDPDTPPEWTA